ncbi:MAG: hypothetical protein DRP73_03490 [Candidatus Omnitrophota bacterium]|nr:MAG: hypothetical protein DRP73_03490 [Candidatus Omnitrophota bacterium]
MNPANVVTSVRLFFLPVFIYLIWSYHSGSEHLRVLAFWVAVVSFLSDALDGFLARRKGWKTKFGTFLDPFCDKLLLDLGFLILILKPEFKNVLSLPLWVAAIVIFRDLLLGAGTFILYIKGNLEIRPSYLGKSAVVLQMFSILSALLYMPFTSLIWMIAGFMTALATIGYLIREIPHFLS